MIFTGQAGDRIAAMARDWGSGVPVRPRAALPGAGLELALIRITSAVPDGDGSYAAVFTARDSAGEWADFSETKARGLNDEQLTEGTVYASMPSSGGVQLALSIVGDATHHFLGRVRDGEANDYTLPADSIPGDEQTQLSFSLTLDHDAGLFWVRPNPLLPHQYILSMAWASETQAGSMSTSPQRIGGVKVFEGGYGGRNTIFVHALAGGLADNLYQTWYGATDTLSGAGYGRTHYISSRWHDGMDWRLAMPVVQAVVSPVPDDAAATVRSGSFGKAGAFAGRSGSYHGDTLASVTCGEGVGPLCWFYGGTDGGDYGLTDNCTARVSHSSGIWASIYSWDDGLGNDAALEISPGGPSLKRGQSGSNPDTGITFVGGLLTATGSGGVDGGAW